MEHRTALIDTSIIIDFLRKKHKDKAVLWRLREQYACAMSAVTLFELLSGAKTEKHVTDIAKLAKWIDILPFDNATAKFAAEFFRILKAENKLIEFRDIFIAATAKQHQLGLATLNTDHFERMTELRLLELP
ncbi:MAG: type II toxin-antitoxin system VapC family toxin [Gammaproteobacteria bacterium]|nr:type II toxin-antitoxin system VapC family toxin [Gammaproteobacteria bacterium]